MTISVFDLFKIGIGPSSSHTVGPMVGARQFVEALESAQLLDRVVRVSIQLFGSLGATGKGHGTDKAVLLGLEGSDPVTVDISEVDSRLKAINDNGRLTLNGRHSVVIDTDTDLVLHKKKSLPFHPNAMQFEAFDSDGKSLSSKIFYSVGGGFIVDETASGDDNPIRETSLELPMRFTSADQLLKLCTEHEMSIAQIMRVNEQVWREDAEITEELMNIWSVMESCVWNGCQTEGILPGGMKVRRRAPQLYRLLTGNPEGSLSDPLTIMDWISLYALAVNEENAAGGRVVTAPTNGAAGIVPAVLHYYRRFVPGASDQGVVDFLLTAGAIGILYKENASISGAEVGCQGEVGSACSMAAGALAAVLGGTPEQIENAAEIAMEHNLGLTCDPVGGLVQVPCIERNAMAAVKAVNAARMALRGDGSHFVSLDKVILTMRDTGADMKKKYKETARGGLAVNVVEVPVNFPEC